MALLRFAAAAASVTASDSANVNVSIASFLIVRPAYAYIGYGAGYLTPKWNDAFLWDVGLPVSDCRNGSVPGTFERDWTCVFAQQTALNLRASFAGMWQWM